MRGAVAGPQVELIVEPVGNEHAVETGGRVEDLEAVEIADRGDDVVGKRAHAPAHGGGRRTGGGRPGEMDVGAGGHEHDGVHPVGGAVGGAHRAQARRSSEGRLDREAVATAPASRRCPGAATPREGERRIAMRL